MVQKIEFSEACDFVNANHRHHIAPRGHKFSLAAYEGLELLGVAMCGNPVSRHLMARGAIEVNRLCTLGGKNVCSFLYAACAREAKRRGYKWILTYILKSEPGTSLKAAGWIRTKETPGKAWGNVKRPRTTKHPLGKKIRYDKYF